MAFNTTLRAKLVIIGVLVPVALFCLAGALYSLAVSKPADTIPSVIDKAAAEYTAPAPAGTSSARAHIPPVPAMTHEEAYEMLSALTPPFTLSHYNGLLCVYNGGETPVVVFDILTNSLPEADRLLLDEGIYCQTYEDLLMSIEDYSS